MADDEYAYVVKVQTQAYRDCQALEPLHFGKVELHLSLDGIAIEEQRGFLRIYRPAPHFEGKPVAAVPVLQRKAVFVPETSSASSRASWSGTVSWQFLSITLHGAAT
jgi:hypothetical protein